MGDRIPAMHSSIWRPFAISGSGVIVTAVRICISPLSRMAC